MAPHPPVSILVIDDEPSLVRALARLLQRDGYVVATARNGRHALAALQAQPYDVILCDLRMPELDGRAFYAQLQQRAPALCQRVMFLTGDSTAADHQAFLAQCGRPWLRKPCSIAARAARYSAGARGSHAGTAALPHMPGTAAAAPGCPAARASPER